MIVYQNTVETGRTLIQKRILDMIVLDQVRNEPFNLCDDMLRIICKQNGLDLNNPVHNVKAIDIYYLSQVCN